MSFLLVSKRLLRGHRKLMTSVDFWVIFSGFNLNNESLACSRLCRDIHDCCAVGQTRFLAPDRIAAEDDLSTVYHLLRWQPQRQRYFVIGTKFSDGVRSHRSDSNIHLRHGQQGPRAQRARITTSRGQRTLSATSVLS